MEYFAAIPYLTDDSTRQGMECHDLDRSLLAAGLALFLAGPGCAAIDALFPGKGE